MTRAGESPGVVDLDGWVAFGDQKPRESVHDGARLLGSYSGAEPSLRERGPFEKSNGRPHDSNTARWLETRGGSVKPMRR
jgi:hypothetical protein